MRSFLTYALVIVSTLVFVGCSTGPKAHSNESSSSFHGMPASEEEHWAKIRESKDASDFHRFLERRPTGKYESLAKLKLKLLARGSTK